MGQKTKIFEAASSHWKVDLCASKVAGMGAEGMVVVCNGAP